MDAVATRTATSEKAPNTVLTLLKADPEVIRGRIRVRQENALLAFYTAWVADVVQRMMDAAEKFRT